MLRNRSLGFTLLEMLFVLALMAILTSLAIPATLRVMRSASLTTGGLRLVDQLSLARQTAMARNCQVECRFYQLPDPSISSSTTPAIYRAFQLFSLDNDASQTNAITKVIFLPDGIVMANNNTVSSLLPATPSNPPYFVAGTTAGTSLGRFSPGSYNYLAFHFKPDGSTDLNPVSSSTWFVSIINQHDPIPGGGALPSNFFTVQIDAQSGQVRSFRPN